MNLQENVRVEISEGAVCFVCEAGTSINEVGIQVKFDVVVKPLIATIRVPVTKWMHMGCAKDLHLLLGRRIKEAKAK